MPDWFLEFDSYLSVPRGTINLATLSYASPGSGIFVDKQFFDQFSNCDVVASTQGFPLVCDIVLSTQGVYLVYLPRTGS
jgi:hypothetical protein